MKLLPFVLVVLLLSSASAAEDVSALLDRLRGANPALRAQAVDRLAKHREPRVLVALLLALRDTDANVRAHAAEALRVFGDRRAVPFLHRNLGDRNATVRCRVLLSLGELGDRYLVPSLTHALVDEEAMVRAAAIRALGEIGDPLSLADILGALRDGERDVHGSVTAAGIIACARIGGARGLDRAMEVAGDRVSELWFLRAVYARAIGVARDERRVVDLVSYLSGDQDARVAQAAAGSLALLGRVDLLEEATKSDEGFRRKAATAGLATMDSAGVDEILIRMVKDRQPTVVLEAADGLAGRGNVDAIPILIRLLEVDNPVWMGALAGLQRRTGRTFDRNPPRWRDWFESNREHLVFDRDAGTFRVE